MFEEEEEEEGHGGGSDADETNRFIQKRYFLIVKFFLLILNPMIVDVFLKSLKTLEDDVTPSWSLKKAYRN